MALVAPLTGSVDRNRNHLKLVGYGARSLPSRGAWIEISFLMPIFASHSVAPLTGSVDRNRFRKPAASKSAVAPLTGSVDRNHAPQSAEQLTARSLPSRGAWIEIHPP